MQKHVLFYTLKVCTLLVERANFAIYLCVSQLCSVHPLQYNYLLPSFSSILQAQNHFPLSTN